MSKLLNSLRCLGIFVFPFCFFEVSAQQATEHRDGKILEGRSGCRLVILPRQISRFSRGK